MGHKYGVPLECCPCDTPAPLQADGGACEYFQRCKEENLACAVFAGFVHGEKGGGRVPNRRQYRRIFSGGVAS